MYNDGEFGRKKGMREREKGIGQNLTSKKT